ncbi:MAG: DUF6460 domain-containing protein [Hyphomicrobiaceae bacterium]|nr:DUF6460 domain-containing protein [Hyphomicrobiaceae bacterium]
MDSKTIFGGNPLGVIIRLVLLSIAVGIVLSVLGITPQNFLERLNTIITNIYNLGFDAFESILGYLLLGAMVVIPIWLVMRLASARKSRPPES